MKNLLILCLALSGCQIDVPFDEVKIPPIENNTQVVLNMPDGFFGGMCDSDDTVIADDPILLQKLQEICIFQELPDYSMYNGYLAYCENNCCFWRFPEPKQVCEEKWCLSLHNNCGWEMISWECHSY